MMTEPALHLDGVGTTSEEQRCQRVMERVEASPGSPDLLGDWLEHSSAQVVGIERCTSQGGNMGSFSRAHALSAR